MKIALVSPYDYSHPGGVMSHVHALANEYTKLGHEVKIIAPTSQKIKETKNFVPIGSAKAIPVVGTVVRITPSLRLGSKIKETLEEEQFDIVHLHEPFMPMLCSAFLKYSKTTNIGTFHACDGRPGYRLGAPITTMLLLSRNKNLHGHIAVSKAAKKYAANFVPGDFTIIPNGVDLELFNPKVEPFNEYKDGKINIVFVGRFEKRKGPKYLLKAYKELQKKHDNLRLIFVGPGTLLRKECEKYVEHYNLKNVEFIGDVSYQDLPRWYKTGDIFCSPATGQESFGMVLIEAMAVGTPIVCSSNEGYSQVVTNRKDGLFCKPHNVQSLISALDELISDEQLRKSLSSQGLNTVKQYSWTLIAERLLNYYQKTIDNRKAFIS